MEVQELYEDSTDEVRQRSEICRFFTRQEECNICSEELQTFTLHKDTVIQADLPISGFKIFAIFNPVLGFH